MLSTNSGELSDAARTAARSNSSCIDSPGEDGIVIYEVDVANGSTTETFRIAVSTEEQIEAAEQALRNARGGVISGVLVPGDGGFNEGYSWHLDPESVSFPDVAMEVCDGGPSFVESDLEYWIETVGSFCPWGAEVTGRIDD